MADNQHNEIMLALGRLEGGVEAIVERLNKVNGRLDRHEEEIDVIEKKMAFAKGKASVSTIICSSIISIIVAVITYVLVNNL